MNETTLEEVKQLAASGDYKLIPVKREILSDIRTPLEVMKRLQAVSSHVFLLESAEDPERWGRYTFLGFEPSMEISCKDHILTVVENGETTSREVEHPSSFLKEVLEANRSPRLAGFPTLTGGLVGYFSYDYLTYGEPSVKLDAPDENKIDDVNLMLFDQMICFDNLKHKIILMANVTTSFHPSNSGSLEENYSLAFEKIKRMEEIIRHGEEKKAPGSHLLGELTPRLTREEFTEKIEKIKHHIHEGDIFQLVFSNPMSAPFEGSLLNTYRVLRTTNPSPYMFYFSGDDVEIAGASPETLVKVENRVVNTFPLAGTRPRGKDDAEDKALEESLMADDKEKAEHNMLVDLGRNDIGRLCKFGSVNVDKYMNVLRYSHVMHIGSSVKGTLRDDVDAIDAIDTCLPAGTLSGAPKIRACQIINELEGDKRGIYGGAIGYLDFTGNLDVCIAIRMAVKRKGKVFVRSGAGIVADSQPDKEFQECINKAKAVVEAIKTAEEVEE